MHSHSAPSTNPAQTRVLRSQFAHDPDMAELVEYFLDDLRTRIDKMTGAWQSSSHDELRTLTHQLKGAAGGYGYPSITTSAAELEAALKARPSGAADVAARMDALIDLCRRAAAAADPG